MSHFSVAVLHYSDQDIETLLAPYDEGCKVDKYIEYTRQQAIDHVRKHYKSMAGASDEACWKYLAEDAGEGMVDDQGNIYSDYNPHATWDWWEIGGRWKGFLKLRNGGHADSARLGDIDFSPDRDVYEGALRFWDVVVDHIPALPGEKYPAFYNEEYYRQYYGDRETYARHMSAFSTYDRISIHTFFRTVIASHNEQVGPDRQFTVGDITVHDKTVYRKLNYPSAKAVWALFCSITDADGVAY